MATKEQTRANQKNAKKSTGPRTAEGKAKSSQNALKHGLRAQSPILFDENPDDFEFLVSELEDQFQPQTALEWTLLRQLADAEWRMRRVPGLETALFAAKIDESVRHYDEHPERLPEDEEEADRIIVGAATESDAIEGDTLSKLSRYESRLSHRYFKALDHLQKIQSQRRREAEPGKRPLAAPGPNGTVTPGGSSTGAPPDGQAGHGRVANGIAANRKGAEETDAKDKGVKERGREERGLEPFSGCSRANREQYGGVWQARSRVFIRRSRLRPFCGRCAVRMPGCLSPLQAGFPHPCQTNPISRTRTYKRLRTQQEECSGPSAAEAPVCSPALHRLGMLLRRTAANDICTN